MSHEVWEKEVMKKIRFMTSCVWDGIKKSDIDSFLNNFGEDRVVGLVLLDMLIYYSYEQEECLTENLIRLLNHRLWLNDIVGGVSMESSDILSKMKKIYGTMCFVPVKDSDPSDSANSLSTLYKKCEYMSKDIEFADVKDIPLKLVLKKKYIVFYDDIIGTGNQFDKFWSKKHHFGDEKTTLKDIAENNADVQFYYLVFGGYKKSIDELMNKYPNVNIIASEIFTSDYSIFDDNNEYWEFNEDKKEMVIEFVKKKQKELVSATKFSLNLPILFQHSRASNTALSLYWFSSSDKWKELYRR